ncbi:MAG: arylsulfatase [Isosphaeraceae bacterium]
MSPIAALLLLGVIGSDTAGPASGRARPNVVLIITDDQGYGDLSIHGNPVLATPSMDSIARDGVQLADFHVSPVCSPTRASLMTGRYNYRTGVVDTYIGRSMMHPDEVTLAEMMASHGYTTGIFGKWHLGDCFPLRPNDQGFQEALVLKGGGIGQPSDPPGGTSYFDPILQRNGQPARQKGHITDIITDAANRFILENHGRPFFAYVAYNAPHTPLEVKDADFARFRDLDLSHARFPRIGHALPGKAQDESTARVYGLIADIDRNVGRLLGAIDQAGLARDTIVVFLTDNGPQQARFNGGMLDRKGSVHEGGTRVPCFLRWPGHLPAGREVKQLAAHIDLLPTLLDACGLPRPEGVRLDGVSLLPLLIGDDVAWPDRTVYFQWHRGDIPEPGRAFAARSQDFKLVRPEGKKELELYDMAADRLEQHDIAGQQPRRVEEMYAAYLKWFEDVRRDRNFQPPRIILGDIREPITTLTRQDWRGPRAGWNDDSLGYWEVRLVRDIRGEVGLTFLAPKSSARAHLRLGGLHLEKAIEPGETTCEWEGVEWPAGPARLEAWISPEGTADYGVRFVEVRSPAG